MHRRSFIKTASVGALTLCGVPYAFPKGKTHLVTLSFDDGFKRSFYKTADIFEEFGLKACLNVIASGHLSSFKAPDQWIRPELLGNFDDWNRLQERGHEIMPHSWDHVNLAKIPYTEATLLIDKCLDYFEQHLEGFKSTESVYNFAFNASTPELDAYALSKVKAVRTNGERAVNPIPKKGGGMRIGCKSKGPENIDHWVEEQVNNFLKTEGGWLVLNTHGLDKEGWGPMSSAYLRKLLKRLVQVDSLSIIAAGAVLAMQNK
ncbi:polysaccharide deacetylase family protein [Chryseosolibacter indicus]|uniref:Polysaccharide deacetylase family protein n=1 Tax=Chryseosolibacter indicus TaxID=2782351 RepID=A0ABS5VRP9_9BACT|nr:polysaccharide deacetylase family protein [Chryseosolibacter indicus]MBT1704102.1 polysaccharide deacetylase family protein [Chryseosolibacter indicus]